MLTTAMGVVYFDMATQAEGIEAFCHRMELAIDLLRKTKIEYDH